MHGQTDIKFKGQSFPGQDSTSKHPEYEEVRLTRRRDGRTNPEINYWQFKRSAQTSDTAETKSSNLEFIFVFTFPGQPTTTTSQRNAVYQIWTV